MRTQVIGLTLTVMMLGHFAAATKVSGKNMIGEAVSGKNMIGKAVSAKQAKVSGAVNAAGSALSAVGSAMSTAAKPMMDKMEGSPTQAEITKTALGLAAGPSTAPVVPEGCQSAYALVKDNPDFSIIKAAIEAAGLVSVFDDPALVATAFVPTNEAVAETLALIRVPVEAFLSDPLTAAAVLKAHVIPGFSLSKDELVAGQPYDTLLEICEEGKKGEECEIEVLVPEVEKTISLMKAKTNPAEATETTWFIGGTEITDFDVQANCPTTVHIIDALILPIVNFPEEGTDVKEVLAIARGEPVPPSEGPTVRVEAVVEEVGELPIFG